MKTKKVEKNIDQLAKFKNLTLSTADKKSVKGGWIVIDEFDL